MAERSIAIIGGGASGLASAVEAARTLKKSNVKCDITIYERLPKIGKKILATGNGRCNILNKNNNIKMYNGGISAAKQIFNIYPIDSNIEFFESMGLKLCEEADGRMYPMSSQAASVLDALRFEIANLGVNTVTDCKITSIAKKNKKYILNDEITADAVIVAGGGKSSPVQGSDGSCFILLSSLGIKIKPTYPSLTGIVTKRKNKLLKGTRAKGEILIVENDRVIASSYGELQYTDFGISGIPAMEVSRAVSEHYALHRKGKLCASVNSLPDFSPEETYNYILSRIKSNGHLLCEDLLSGLMPKKLGMTKLDAASIAHDAEASTLTENMVAELTEAIHSDICEISGVRGFEQSQVTAGGADTQLFSDKTLEAKNINGLFACGEVLDIDGRCGGYNLSWAWSSGRCAGSAAAKYITEI